MKKNKEFTTPCYMVVKDNKQANHLMCLLTILGGRKLPKIQDKISYPCVYAVSTKIISILELSELTSEGLIDCKENEKLFIALAALRNDSDIHQWFTDGTKWVMSDVHSLLELKEYCQELGFNYSKTHKASPEELIKHFN